MRKTEIGIIIIIVLSFAVSFVLWPQMPERMASHWNFQGQADGYMPKFWGLFLMPFISLLLFLFFLLVPKIDPLKENIKKFRKYFDSFILLIFLFLFYIYLLSLVWNLGAKLNIGRAVAPALGIVFYYAGVLMEKAKRNWFIGIRTPWTLSNENVWNKTHRFGGKLFKISGVAAFLGLFLPKQAMWLIIVPIVFSAISIVFYSFLAFQKEDSSKLS